MIDSIRLSGIIKYSTVQIFCICKHYLVRDSFIICVNIYYLSQKQRKQIREVN